MKKFIKILLALQFLLCVQQLSAQRVEWIKQFGGKGDDVVEGFIPDSSGGYIVWGRFQDVIKIGEFELKDSVESPISFVARFDTLGNVLWAKSVNMLGLACRIGYDKQLYILTKYAYQNNYNKSLIKIEVLSGRFLWRHNIKGDSYMDFFQTVDIYMDSSNRVYITTYASSLDDVVVPYVERMPILIIVEGNGTIQYAHFEYVPDQSIMAYTRFTLENEILVEWIKIPSTDYRFVYYKLSLYHIDTLKVYSKMYYSDIEVPNISMELNSVSHKKNVSSFINLNESVKLDGTIYFSSGQNDIILLQFDKTAKLLWKKQFGGKGNEQVFYNKFSNDTVVLGINTTEDFTCDNVIIPAGKQYIFFDENGKCVGIKPFIEPQINKVTTILDSVIVNDAGIGYTAGTISNKLDTLVSKGNRDIYFAKVSCKPAYLKQITGVSKTCKGNSLQFSTEYYGNMIYTWETDKKSTIQNNGTSSPSIQFDTTGRYIVKVTPSNSCGVGDPIFMTVEVNDKPQKISTIVGDTVVCSGLKAYSVQAVKSGLINWSVDGGGILTADKNNVTVNWHTPGYYTLSASEYNECGDGAASKLQVLVQAPPVQPSTITGNTSVCRGTELYSIATVPATKYEWYLNKGGQLTGAQSKTSVNWTIPGTHSLLVTASNTCGTSLPQTLSVTVKDVPIRPTPIRGEDKACVGRYVYYTDKVSGLSYNWTINGGGQLSHVENTAEVNWLVPGSFTMKVTQSNECGAGLPTTLLVKILDVPQQLDSIIGLEKVCQGKQIYAVAQRADEEYKWELAGGGSLLPNANTATINWMAAGAYTLSVSPFNQCGTGKAIAKVVTVSSSSSQVGMITGNDKPCLKQETYTVANVTGLSYLWKLSEGGTLTQNQNNATIQWSKPGIYTIHLNTSDNCAVSMIAQVKDKPSLPDAIVGNDLVCLGEMSYQVNNVPEVDYIWTMSGGGTLTPYSSAVNVDWTQSGIYSLSVAAKNVCGTSDTSRLKVKVLQAPQTPSIISGNDTVCLTTENYVINLIPDAEYNWWLSNSGGILTNNNNATQIEWQYAHENVLNVSAENLCGTSPIRSLPIVVKTKPSQVPILGDSLACTGKGIYFVHPQTETEYVWKLYSGGTLLTNHDTAQVQWLKTGNHIISVTPKNFCGLGQESARSINVNTVPQLSDTIQGKNTVCQGVEFYSLVAHPGTQYQWTVTNGGSLLSLGTSAKIFWTGAGKQILTATPYNECGAGLAIQKQVNVKRIPDSTSLISGNRSVCKGTQLYSVTRVPEVSYSWNLPKGGVLTSSDAQASINWTDEGFYSLSVVPSNQCGTGPTQTASIQVTAKPAAPRFISSDTTACLGNTSNQQIEKLGSFAYNWFLDSTKAGELTADNAQATTQWKKTGTFWVKVNASNQCGASDTVSQRVRVNTVPAIADTIGGAAEPCQGVQYYAVQNKTNVQFDWNVSAGGSLVGLGSSAKILWTGAGKQIVSVTPRNECGAGNSMQKSIMLKQLPDSIAVISGKQNVCIGAQSYSVAAMPEVSYVWQLSKGGTKTDNQNAVTVNWLNEGVFALSVTPSNRCGIGASKTITVTVGDRPAKPQFISSDTMVCSGKTSVSVLKSQIDKPSFNWLLSDAQAGKISSKNQEASILWNKTGRFTLLVSASNSCGNSDTAKQFMNIHSVPVITDTISGDKTLCQGIAQYSIAAQSQVQYNWSVSSGGAVTSNGNTAKVFWNGSGAQSIFVVPANECGNGAAITKTLTIKTAPQTATGIIGSSKVCLGTQEYSCNKETGLSYLWTISTGGVLVANENKAQVNWQNSGVNTISLQTKNDCGLSPISNLAVTVGQKPLRPQFAQSDSTACKGSATAHQVFAQDDCSYLWGILGGSATINSQTNTATAVWKNTGKQTVWVAAKNYCGISDSATQTLAVKTVPSLASPITGRTTLCLGKAEYHLYNPEKNILNWNINGGGSLLPQGDSAQVDWFTAGQYKISVTPANECGNGNTQTLVVQTVTKPQQPDAILANAAACLKVNTELSTSAVSGVNYQWICDTSGSLSSSVNKATVLFRQSGMHVITLIPNNSCGQGPATTATIYVSEPPKNIAEIVGDSVTCLNNNRIYTIAPEQGVNYEWMVSNSGDFTSDNNFVTLRASKTGDFIVSVVAKNQCGTVAPPAKLVRVKTVPTQSIRILGDSVSCLGKKEYKTDSAKNAVVWNIDGGGVLTATNAIASVNWNSPGSYRIQAQETNQCGSGQLVYKTIAVTGAPALPVDISGNLAVCAGIKNQYHSLLLPEIEYQWQVIGRTADTAYKAQHGNTAEITFVEAGTAQLSVHSYNRCGQSQSRYLTVNVESPLSKVPFTILGDSMLCINSTTSFSTSLVNDFDWRWSIDSALTHGTFKNSAQVEWSKAGKFTLAATPYNSCGTGDTAYFGVQVEVPLQKPVIEYRGDSLVVVTTSEVLWYKNYAIFDEAKQPLIAPVTEGNYTVQTKNSCGTSPMSDTAYIAPAQWLSARIFPNPAMGKTVTIELPLNYDWKSFEILNSLGKPLSQHQNTGQSRVVVSIEDIPAGIYFVAVKGTKFNISGKFTRLRE